MKMTFIESILLAGLLGCCSGSQAGSGVARPCVLPVASCVKVREVRGAVEYAYHGTGWRTLAAGKQLRAGATVRAAAGSSAILQVDHRSSLVKVCSATTLRITLQAPEEEKVLARLAVAR